MLELDMLRQILEQQAILTSSQLGFRCKIGEEPFVVPTDGSVYAEFWFRTGTTKQMELAGFTAWECDPGLVQFTLFAPEKSGLGALMKLGGQIKRLWNRQQYQVPPDGYVVLEPISTKLLPGLKNGHKVLIVDAGFDFFHRQPNPNLPGNNT